MRVTHGITEIGSLMTVMRHAPSYFMDSLKSVAAPGSEKLYRKSLLAYIVNKRFGYGLDVPIQNEPLTAAYKFGDNMTIDMLCLYEMKHVGREIASRTVSSIPKDVEDLVCGLNLSFFERVNMNFLGSIPSYCRDYYVSRLVKAGILPYDEEDWYELDAVCKFLSHWHREFDSRSANVQIGCPRKSELIEIPCNFSLEAKPGANNWMPITSTLEKSKKYDLHVGQVRVDTGKTPQVYLRLYDMQGNAAISGRAFAITGNQGLSGLQWTFETPNEDGDYRVIAYAGVPGKCDGVGVSYVDVRIS